MVGVTLAYVVEEIRKILPKITPVLVILLKSLAVIRSLESAWVALVISAQFRGEAGRFALKNSWHL